MPRGSAPVPLAWPAVTVCAPSRSCDAAPASRPARSGAARRRIGAVLLLALAVVAAGCGVSRDDRDAVAATIVFSDGGEVEISGDELTELVQSVVSEPDFQELAYGETPVDEIEREMLTRLVQRETVAHLRSEAGATVDEATLTEVQTALNDQLVQFFEDDADAMAESLSPFIDLLATTAADQEALGAVLVAEVGDVPCASHILVDDEGQATELLAQLDDGADFAELATEFSLDPGSGAQGGDLGCADPSLYVAEFADAIGSATEGEIVGPVQTQFGYHLIVVTGYEPVDPATVDANSLSFTAVEAELREAIVTVDPAVGAWDPQSGFVVGIEG